MTEDLNKLNKQLNEEITKRKQIEDALREREAQYKALFEGSPDAILLADPATGIILEANPAASLLLARPYEEIVGLHQSNIHPPQKEKYSREAFNQHVAETRERAESHPIENTVSRPDGSEVPVEVLAQLVSINGKKVLQGVFRDITERKQVEQALRKSEERLWQAVRVSQIGIFDHDHLTDTIYWSPQQRDIYGFAPDEKITLSVFLDCVYHEDRERIALAVRHAHDPAGDGLYDVEHRIIRRDGAIRWLITRSQTFFEGKDGARYPVRTVGAVRDVTERKQASEEQQKLVSIIETSADLIGIADLEGRLLYLNSAGQKLVGLDSIEDVRNKPVHQFHMEADYRKFESEIFPSILQTGSWMGETAFRHFRTGAPIPVDMNSFLIRDGITGRPIAIANISRDITARKHEEKEKKLLQAQLLQAQKMEAIGQLAGGVAHDFNNILTAIIGYGSILQKKMTLHDPLRTNVDRILESAGRAAQLTHSLLAFSRRQVLNMKPTHLNGIIARQEQFLLRIIGEDVELKSILRGDAVIMADSGQIEQVLMNLATNARDAMPKGGQLTIETDLLEMTDAFISAHGFGEPGTYAVISVTDTGIGMDEEAKQKIFEPFFTTKEVGRGTGLGMAIVYGIVKQHKGYINVYSQVGKGTTFKIYLPVHGEQVEQQEISIAASPVKTGTETILLAEDDATLRTFFRDLLTEHGYTVVVAENGEDAIRKFFERKDEIQLCVLDMIMPKKSGREAFEAIQKMKPGIKVIFSSGYTADKVQWEGLPVGSAFIAKPAPPQDYLNKIREVLDGYMTT